MEAVWWRGVLLGAASSGGKGKIKVVVATAKAPFPALLPNAHRATILGNQQLYK